MLTLSQHQSDVQAKILNAFTSQRIVSVSGAGGVGKTFFTIGFYKQYLGKRVLSATTNKAAKLLVSKERDMRTVETQDDKRLDLQVKTADAAILETQYTPLGAELQDYCEWRMGTANEGVDGTLDRAIAAKMDIDRIEELAETGYENMMRRMGLDPHGPEYQYQEKQPKPYQGGLLIIDEASMLTVKMLGQALQVYDKVLLIGDHMQLPPVTEERETSTVWAQAETALELTEQHRATAELARFTAYIRAGGRPGKGQHEEGMSPDAKCVYYTGDNWLETLRKAPKEVPVLTYKNATVAGINTYRLRHTEDKTSLPVICEDKPYKGEIGTYDAGSGRATFGAGDEATAVRVHFATDYDHIGKRVNHAFGLTVHKSQGSEWDTVIVDLAGYDLARWLERTGKAEKGSATNWLYTAVTRARKRVVFIKTPRNFTGEE